MFNSRRGRTATDIPCIFVHAGAGYHSVQNEGVHLQACNDAAKAAMAIMRNGGSAVDAIEIAVKILEDREITNAGYGSNLAMDGVVECDAVLVDHFGRSGGAGAVAQVKNPISLARLLLDHTSQSLSLRRVPPNLLVGQGATDYAYEHDVSILPLDCLISPAARERWKRWKNDLIKAERSRRMEEARRYGISPAPSQHDLTGLMRDQSGFEQIRRAHTNAMMAAVWNEAQPISPPPSDSRDEMEESSFPPSHSSSSLSLARVADSKGTTPDATDEYTEPYVAPGMLLNTSRNVVANTTQKGIYSALFGDVGLHTHNDGELAVQRQYVSERELSGLDEHSTDPLVRNRSSLLQQTWHDGSSGSDSDATAIAFSGHSRAKSSPEDDEAVLHYAVASPLPETPLAKQLESPTPQTSTPLSHVREGWPPLPLDAVPLRDDASQNEDVVTDTVGAIAIDAFGQIACGASSGGIGMKHRGRIGPAALVGIGAAVIPVDPDDAERMTIATVTSGTGEHMGTTMAAGVCSERLYQNLRKVAGGGYEEADDDEAIRSFIEKDFMSHPSVKHSHSSGAIGILSVKKTKDGAYLYFGHNTDSFALASMHADELKPVCTMSRSKGNGVIAQGGRAIRYRRKKS